MASDELKNILKSSKSRELGDIIRRAREMGELTHVLSKGLPGEYAGAIVAANLREDGDLIVIAASPAWASRLRYETDALLATAREAGLSPTACRVRVTQS
ncbi:MAG: DUF721 domain-containing protein [Gammaproteobacteria bacterium]|nr:DUF721 domain-containing protein [Gammaproteobacteria bacterium]